MFNLFRKKCAHEHIEEHWVVQQVRGRKCLDCGLTEIEDKHYMKPNKKIGGIYPAPACGWHAGFKNLVNYRLGPSPTNSPYNPDGKIYGY